MIHVVGLPRQLILLLLAAILLVPQVSAANSPIAHITDITWEAEGEIGKVLIQLDGPVAYRAVASSTSIVVDLWQARHMQWRLPTMTHPYLPSGRLHQNNTELAPLRAAPLRPARYKTFLTEDSHT